MTELEHLEMLLEKKTGLEHLENLLEKKADVGGAAVAAATLVPALASLGYMGYMGYRQHTANKKLNQLLNKLRVKKGYPSKR